MGALVQTSNTKKKTGTAATVVAQGTRGKLVQTGTATATANAKRSFTTTPVSKAKSTTATKATTKTPSLTPTVKTASSAGATSSASKKSTSPMFRQTTTSTTPKTTLKSTVAQDLAKGALQQQEAKNYQSEEAFQKHVQDMKEPTAAQRVVNTIKGAAKTYGAGLANVAGMAQTGSGLQRRDEAEKEIALWDQDIKAQRDVLNDPSSTESERDTARAVIANLEARKAAYQQAYGVGGEVERTAGAIYKVSDRLQSSGEKDISKAKDRLGSVGRLAVDVGTAGAQMGADAALSPIMFGTALFPMAIRSVGSSAQEARRQGATHEQQVNYGFASGALSVATEKIGNAAAPFKKMFGKGFLDDVIERTMQGLNNSAAGKIALSFMEEGSEEALEDLIQPALQMIYNGKTLGGSYSELEASEILNDFLVGGILGGLGGGVDMIAHRNSTGAQASSAEARQTSNAHNAVTPTQTRTTLDAVTTTYMNLDMGGSKMSLKTASEKADIVKRYLNGETLTPKDINKLNLTDQNMRRVFENFTSAQLPDNFSSLPQGERIQKLTAIQQQLLAERSANEAVTAAQQSAQVMPAAAEGNFTSSVNRAAQSATEAQSTVNQASASTDRDQVLGYNEFTQLLREQDPTISDSAAREIYRAYSAEVGEWLGIPADATIRLKGVNSDMNFNEFEALISRVAEETKQTAPSGLELRAMFSELWKAQSGAQTQQSGAQTQQSGAQTRQGNTMTEARRAKFAQESDGSKGLVYDNYVAGEMDSATAEEINTVAKALGVRVRMAEGDEVLGGLANGEIVGNEIRISKTAQNPVLAVIGHEWLHRVQVLAPEQYLAFRNAVMKIPKVAAEAKYLYEYYNKKGVKTSLDEAKDEAAANYAGEMIANTDVLKDFIRKHSEDRTMLEKLRDALHEIAQKLTGKTKQQVQTAESLLQEAFEAAARSNKKAATEGGKARYHLNENFSRQFDEWLNDRDAQGRLKTGGYFNVGTTSDALKSIGVKDYSIYWDKSKIAKIMGKHTEMTADVVKEVPQILEHPILVMQSQTVANRITIYGETVDADGTPVLVAMELRPQDKKGEILDFAKIASAYGKKIAQNAIDTSEILYVDPNKKRTDTWLEALRLQLPAGLTKYGSIGRVTYVDRDVNGNLSFGEDSGKTAMQAAFEAAGVQIDSETESASPSRYSLKTWSESSYVKDRQEAAKALSAQLGVSVRTAQRYIRSVNSIAKMIADDRIRLDYESSPDVSSFVSNAEYGGSIDFSTICAKRRIMTGTFEAIQRALPNTALTAEEVLTIRKMMADRDYQVSCGLCYVEGSRANMGQYTKQFLEQYAKTNPDYLPNMAEMNTATGQEKIRKEHPEVYAAYTKFMNSLAQRKPKLYQLATEYKNEVLEKFGGKKSAATVDAKNRNGGLRLQSFSDFEIIHLLDCMQVITDMSQVGLAGQAYTKVPDFAYALGNTGLKINLSMIAKGVDSSGRIIYDEVEGMAKADAEALRNKYSKNVGTILVVFTDEQLKAALNDPFVDFIIPFHRSQWNSAQYALMGLPEGTKNYTAWQNESYIEPVYNANGKPKRPANYMPNEYWDFSRSGKENAETYLRMCAANNRKPKFSELLVNNKDGSYSLQPDGSTDGYWKLLIDFKMYSNSGKGSPQMPVRPRFNMREAKRMLNEYGGGHETFPVAQDVVDDFVAQYKSGHQGARFSLKTDSTGRLQGQAVDGTIRKARDTAKGKYWTPNLTQTEWSLLNRRMDAEINDPARALDEATQWTYANEKGTTAFAIYGIGDGTEATPLYASGGKIATADYRAFVNAGKRFEYGTDGNRGALNRWFKDRRSKERHSDGSVSDAQGRQSTDGHDRVPIVQGESDGRGSDGNGTENRGEVKTRFSLKIKHQAPRISKEADEKYMTAVQEGDTWAAQRMVDKAAKAAGYTTQMLYHGTGRFGYTSFDMNAQTASSGLIYATDKANVAANYGGSRDTYAFQRSINKRLMEGDSTEAVIHNAESVLEMKTHVVTEAERKAAINGVVQEFDAIAETLNSIDYDDFAKLPGWNLEDYQDSIANAYDLTMDIVWNVLGEYETNEDGTWERAGYDYLKAAIERFEVYYPKLREAVMDSGDAIKGTTLEGLYDLLAKHTLYDAAVDAQCTLLPLIKEGATVLTDGKQFREKEALAKAIDRVKDVGTYKLYGNPGDNVLEIDANRCDWLSLKVPEIDDKYHSTDFIAKWAKENGYTSVYVKNVYDGGDNANEYIFFDPEQVKSADSVTYDDNGDIIPLSERFNSNEQDIRYSLKTDSTGRELSEAQQEYFKDSKVRDKDGRLKVMYHGTNADKLFTVFDTYGGKFGLFGRGSYFTDNPEVAHSYTAKGRGNTPRTYEVYLDIKNPLDMDAAFDKSAWADQPWDIRNAIAGATTNEDVFRALKQYCEDEEMIRWEAEEFISDTIRSAGFDGITHIGGGRYGRKDGPRHRVFIAFDPEQIKNVSNETPTENPDIRYSLKTVNKKPVVWLENSSLTNKELNSHKAVADFIAEHIGEVYTIVESGQKVYLGEDLPSEFTHSKSTSYLRGADRAAARAKNKAVDGLGELIEIATNRRWEKTRHAGNKDAKYGMYRYDSTFAFPVKAGNGAVQRVRAYDVELLIRNASDGKKYLYDIVNIKENTTAQIDLTQREVRSAAYKAATGDDASMGNVPQNAKDVNGKYSIKDTDPSEARATVEDFVKRYNEQFGEGAADALYQTVKQMERAKARAERKLAQQEESAQAERSRNRQKQKDNATAWMIYHEKNMRTIRQEYRAKLDDARRAKAAAVRDAVNETKVIERATADVRVEAERKKAERQHLADSMNAKKQAAERLRVKEDTYAAEKADARDNTKLRRNAAKAALRDKRRVAEKRAAIETAQGPVDTIRKNPRERTNLERVQEAADSLRTLGRSAYRDFVNQAEAIDRFAKRQKGGTLASTLVNIVGGASTTTETIYKSGLVNRAGDRIGDSMKDVFLCWDGRNKKVDENKQALLQDYMLHKHNIDRMSFVSKAREALETFEAANPWVRDMDAKEFAKLTALTDKETEKLGKDKPREIAREYAKLLNDYSEARDKPVFPDKNGNPVTADTSAEIAAQYEAENPWLKEKAEGIYEWWDKFMREWVIGDTLSAEDYEIMHEMYPHYVPTYRADKKTLGAANFVGMGGASVGSVVKKAKGGLSEIVNIEDSFANLADKAIRVARTNELYRNLIDTAMLDDAGTFSDMAVFDWEDMDSRHDAYTKPDGEVVLIHRNDFELTDTVSDAEQAGLQKTKDGYVLSARYDGDVRRAYISEELFKSIQNTTGSSANDLERGMLKLGNALTGPMKTAITGINPSFALRNISRDLPTAIVNSISGMAFPKYYAQALREMGANSEHWQQYKALGGTNATYYNDQQGFAKAMAKRDGIGAKAVEKMGWFNEVTEAQTRFAEYLATIDRLGDTYENRLLGIKNSAEVTVDFSRKGRYGKVINAWVPYWNPAVQGVDKVFRSVIESPDGSAVWKQALKTVGRASMTTVLIEAVLYAILKAADRYDDWEELSDRVKDTYYCIPLKDQHEFLRIPKNREWGAILGTPIMRLLESANGRSDPFENYVETSLEPNFLPGAILRFGSDRIESDIIGVSQALDLAYNKDFAGRSIIPYAYEQGSTTEQYDADTSMFARKLGELLNFSPMQIDYIVQDYFGDFGDLFTAATSEATWSGDTTVQDYAESVLKTLAGTWTSDNRTSNQTVSDYYDMIDNLEKLVQDRKNRLGSDAAKDTVEYQTQKAVEELYGDQISELNRSVRDMADGEEKYGIKEQIAELAGEALSFYGQCMSGQIQNPTLTAEYSELPTSLSNELIRLDGLSNDYSFKPSSYKPSKYNDPDNKNYEYILDDEQKGKYQETYQEVYAELMAEAMNKEQYRHGTDIEKAEILEATRDDVTEETRERFLDWLGENYRSTEKKSKK